MERVVLIGAGGIGAPCALALGEAGLGCLTLVDDDRVELSNLHRQFLFRDEDVGRPKIEALGEALSQRFPRLCVEQRAGRVSPASAFELIQGADVVIDATDNFAARFLLADVCHLAGIPVVHAAAVRLIASVGAFSPEGAPCYRCLFEDLPSGEAPDCASAGVLGPVCGVAGALGANLALRRLREGTDPGGQLLTYDARTDRLRSLRVPRRRDCPLCGESPSILSVDAARYEGPSCSSPEAP